MTALSNRSFEDWRKDGLSWGRLVEVAAGAHLANQSLLHGMDLYYWREGNREVDFVLRNCRPDRALGIFEEVPLPDPLGRKPRAEPEGIPGNPGLPLAVEYPHDPARL